MNWPADDGLIIIIESNDKKDLSEAKLDVLGSFCKISKSLYILGVFSASDMGLPELPKGLPLPPKGLPPAPPAKAENGFSPLPKLYSESSLSWDNLRPSLRA